MEDKQATLQCSLQALVSSCRVLSSTAVIHGCVAHSSFWGQVGKMTDLDLTVIANQIWVTFSFSLI